MIAALSLLAGLAASAAPMQAPPATAPAPAETPAAPAPAPSPAELQASLLAIRDADMQRLLTDRPYAVQILAHLDRVAPLLAGDAEASLAVANLRLLTFTTLGRGPDAGPLIDAILARRPADPSQYTGAWIAALTFQDKPRALAVIETASRAVPGVGWARLRAVLDREAVGQLLFQFRTDHDEASRVRLAEALFRIGWPGEGDTESADFVRSVLLEDRIAHGDAAGAAGFAAGISTPVNVLPLLVRKRYDSVLAPGGDRLALLGRALDRHGRETAEALAAAPRDLRRVLVRAQHLRGLGRDADALAVLAPFTGDVAATVAADSAGMWVINEAGYTLLALGRGDAAVALMRRLAALPVADNFGLIGPDINFAVMLSQAGRHAEALDHAIRLERESGQYANDFGKMWIASSIACALARLGRGGEAAPQLERLRAHRDLNPSALSRAYLCLGDLDGAAALLVHRLESDEPGSAIMALQDYTLGNEDLPEEQLARALVSLRDRPAVRAALDRVGRVLSLPLARAYWGDF